MSTYYPLEKKVNDTTFRGITFYTNSDNDKYRIYYIDSEWKELGNSGSSESVGSFQTIGDFFNDGISWTTKYRFVGLGSQSEPQFKFIVVRLSDRKTGLFTIRGTAGYPTQYVPNAEKTATDISGKAWFDELRRLRLLGYV